MTVERDDVNRAGECQWRGRMSVERKDVRRREDVSRREDVRRREDVSRREDVRSGEEGSSRGERK